MRKEKRIAFICICLLIFFSVSPFSSILHAEETALSLKSAIDAALTQNPEILASRRAYEAASARIWQAASFKDPILEFEYDNMTADRALTGDPMKTYAISQEFPFPTKIFLRAKIASKIAKTAYETYKAKELSIISQTKSAYSELFMVYKTIEVTRENKTVLEQFSSSATARYSAGEGTQADALKAQLELARVDNELIMLEQKRITAQAKLNILMNKDPSLEIGIPEPEGVVDFHKPLEEFYSLTRQNNPELKAYRYAIERGKAAYDLSLNEFMPDFMFRFRQMVTRDRINSKTWAGMLGVTIPLWFFEKQAFGVKEMKSELEMVKAEYRAKENMILFDARDAYARVEANKKLVELYETAFLPQADETVKAALKGYESGKSDFLTLLDSQRMLIDFKISHYAAILDMRVAIADLERISGAYIAGSDKRGDHGKE